MDKKEYEQWFRSCDFIETNMTFYSFKDFLDNRKLIKRLFDSKDIRTKKLYKWYVYASFMTYKRKCLVWDYLNDNMTEHELIKSNKK